MSISEKIKTIDNKINQNIYKVGEFLGKKNVDAVNDNIEKQEPVEEIIVPPEKRDEILNKLRKVL